MVDKKLEGDSTKGKMRFACLSPSSIWRRSLFAFNCTTAISVEAKKAFTKIKNICRNNVAISLPAVKKVTPCFTYIKLLKIKKPRLKRKQDTPLRTWREMCLAIVFYPCHLSRPTVVVHSFAITLSWCLCVRVNPVAHLFIYSKLELAIIIYKVR